VPVVFHFADVDCKLNHKLLLKQFIAQQFLAKTEKKISLNVVFCSDDFLLNINKSFLQHDYFTDIITFPLEETPKKTVAEIYISLDRVWENAQKQKVTFENELLRVLFHGVIHLTGFNDKTKAEKQLMSKEEDAWLFAFYQMLDM
jgi:rRNA maturation RNase YbeY